MFPLKHDIRNNNLIRFIHAVITCTKICILTQTTSWMVSKSTHDASHIERVCVSILQVELHSVTRGLFSHSALSNSF
jgi:hypothetical protein